MKLQQLVEQQSFLTDHKQIHEWCERHGIEDIVIGKHTGHVHVQNSVNLHRFDHNNLPVQFGTVEGDFSIVDSALNTLKGCPIIVEGEFNCAGNRSLRSLQYSPRIVKEAYVCTDTSIESFQHVTQNASSYYGRYISTLKTLQGLPKKIKIDLNISYSGYKTLNGIPDEIGEDLLMLQEMPIGEIPEYHKMLVDELSRHNVVVQGRLYVNHSSLNSFPNLKFKKEQLPSNFIVNGEII